MDKRILIFGAGKIGAFLYTVLKSYGHDVKIIDQKPLYALPFPGSRDIEPINYIQYDIGKSGMSTEGWDILNLGYNSDVVISCLPYQLSKHIVNFALNTECSYFDFTEDIEMTKYARQLAPRFKKKFLTLAPGCGLAPGYVEIAAAHLVKEVEKDQGKGHLYSIDLMVGGNPVAASHPSYYGFTWSLDGLVNQYMNPTDILLNGELISFNALEKYEVVNNQYEAFLTSGGHGQFYTFAKKHKIPNAQYKTLRYKGHLNYVEHVKITKPEGIDMRSWLKNTFSRDMAVVPDDIVKIKIKGYYNDAPGYRVQFDKEIKAREVLGRHRTAMEIATVGSAAQVIHYILKNEHKKKYQGLVLQTDLPKSVFRDKKNFPELILTEV